MSKGDDADDSNAADGVRSHSEALDRPPLGMHMAAVVLLVSAPLVIFLRHHDYGMAQPEALLIRTGVILLGLLVAFLMTRRLVSPAGPVIAYALLVTAVVDLQAQTADRTWLLATTFAVTALLAWVLRKQLAPIALAAAFGFYATSYLNPAGAGNGTTVEAEPAQGQASAAAASRQPPVLHLILDEAIGVDAIPPLLDRRDVRKELLDFYRGNAFALYPDAYSRYYLTYFSLSAVFNDGDAAAQAPAGRAHRLTTNRLFDALSERGYQLRVHQSDFLDLCSGARSPVAFCRTHTLETPRAITGSGLDLRARLHILLGMLARRSSLAPELGGTRVSTLSSMALLRTLEAEAAALQPGTALVAHLMLPHFPYAYDATCRLRPDLARWQHASEAGARAPHYSRGSRKSRYPLYLEQLACTHQMLGRIFAAMRATGRYDESLIVVHGDHGSRISVHKPVPRFAARLVPTDYIDSFPTLFAVKSPRGAASVIEGAWPIDVLVPAAYGLREPGERPPAFVRLIDGGSALERPLPANPH